MGQEGDFLRPIGITRIAKDWHRSTENRARNQKKKKKKKKKEKTRGNQFFKLRF